MPRLLLVASIFALPLVSTTPTAAAVVEPASAFIDVEIRIPCSEGNCWVSWDAYARGCSYLPGVLVWETTGIVAGGVENIDANGCADGGGGSVGDYDATCIAGTAKVVVLGIAVASDADSDCADPRPLVQELISEITVRERP